ncbi:uncharacterized protein LOC132405917 [Hypanus sabinus]|uniref:uncharacterized protein LOC132405917 n=1 Tax=Hypanus sabinus TaxID=79690 RepID=UPI0028C4BC04|nr:uncharacterized protein LOC132405917 [Hypanus sabinus]
MELSQMKTSITEEINELQSSEPDFKGAVSQLETEIAEKFSKVEALQEELKMEFSKTKTHMMTFSEDMSSSLADFRAELSQQKNLPGVFNEVRLSQAAFSMELSQMNHNISQMMIREIGNSTAVLKMELAQVKKNMMGSSEEARSSLAVVRAELSQLKKITKMFGEMSSQSKLKVESCLNPVNAHLLPALKANQRELCRTRVKTRICLRWESRSATRTSQSLDTGGTTPVEAVDGLPTATASMWPGAARIAQDDLWGKVSQRNNIAQMLRDIRNLHYELKVELSQMKTNVTQMIAELRTSQEDFRTELAQMNYDITKQFSEIRISQSNWKLELVQLKNACEYHYVSHVGLTTGISGISQGMKGYEKKAGPAKLFLLTKADHVPQNHWCFGQVGLFSLGQQPT